MSTTIDQQFIEFIVKSLVGKPDAVVVERRIDEKGVLLELTVDAEDLGRVIGKRGATAQSLRTLLRALGTKNDARYNLKIVDVNGGPGGDSQDVPKPKKVSKKDKTEDTDEVPDEAVDNHRADTSNDPNDSNDLDDLQDPEDTEEKVTATDDASSDVVSKTRKELEDLDDLDI